jgi:hypothetical protein
MHGQSFHAWKTKEFPVRNPEPSGKFAILLGERQATARLEKNPRKSVDFPVDTLKPGT